MSSCRLCRKITRLQDKKKNIDIAHRTGPKKNGKPRQMIVRFHEHEVKTKFIKNRGNLKGTKFVVAEDLTNQTKKLYDDLRKSEKFFAVYTIAGKIKVKQSEGDRPIEVRSFATYRELMED